MKATRAALGLLAAGALLISACGDDDGGNADASTSTPQTSTTIATSDPSTASSVATSAPGKVDPALAPVVVGFHNVEGGAYSLPEARKAFEAGVKYVNEELGGINGHELKADTCNVDNTPETSVNCANQFVEDGVAAAVQGFDGAVDAALPVLKEAGILEMASGPLGALSNSAIGDVIMFGPSNEGGILTGGLVQAAHSGAKSIAYVLPDFPFTHALYDGVIPSLAEQLGIDAEAYYYPQPTDWATFAATTLSSSPDVVSMMAADPDFLAAIPAFQDAGFTGVFNANTFASFDKLDAANRDNVIVFSPYYTSDMVAGVPNVAQDDIDVFERYTKDITDVTSPTALRTGFYMAVMAAEALRQVDDPTSVDAVQEQAVTATGRAFFTDQDYDCATPSWPGTTSCLGVLIYSSINADGKLEVLPDQPLDMSVAH